MAKLTLRLLVLAASSVLCAVGGEFVYRWWLAPAPDLGELYYADADRDEFDPTTPEGFVTAHEYIAAVEGGIRGRTQFVPGTTLHICYRGFEGREGYDDRGCVPYAINSWGVRDREELCGPKPEGQTRVVCVGDSTTIGWGVRIEDAWVRLTENELRASDDDGIRLVNCGAAGALYPDEYADMLRKRFGRFDPDVVVVTLCMNDLLPVNAGMLHFTKDAAELTDWWWPFSSSRLVRDLRFRLLERDRLGQPGDGVDATESLLALDPAAYASGGPKEVGPVFWDSGVPQRALSDMQAWCQEHGARLGVVIWPFCQALDGTREDHPFAGMHDRVVAFCAERNIPVLDLLDDFLGHEARSLWITPKDAHGNQRTHAIAAPRYAELIRTLLADE